MVHNPPGGLSPGLQTHRKCTLTVPGGGNFIERLVTGVGEYKCSHTRGFGLAHQKYCPRGGKLVSLFSQGWGIDILQLKSPQIPEGCPGDGNRKD